MAYNSARSGALDGAAKMKLTLGTQVGCFGLADGIETAEVDFSPVDLDSGLIAHAVAPLNGVNPKDTSLVATQRSTEVLAVGLLRHISQVGDGVVGAITVNVIYVPLRKNAVLVQPRQAVLVLFCARDANDSVAVLGYVASAHSAQGVRRGRHTPSEYSRFWVVAQIVTEHIPSQRVRGVKMFPGHEELQFQIGLEAHATLQRRGGFAILLSDLDRRDAEVVLLRRQIDVDRALLTDSNPRRPDGGTTESNP